MKYLSTFKTSLPCTWLEYATNSAKENVVDLRNLKMDLTNVYANYDGIISQYQAKPAASSFVSHKVLIHSYYNTAPVTLNNELLSRRNNHGLLYCPYCGDPKTPDTLDHFIPKDEWPEFSFFPNNLVPQCRGCAPTKGSQYYCDSTKVIKFLHPIYFDILDKLRFNISVNFNKTNSSVSFEVCYKVSINTSTDEISRLRNHIKNLKIQKRINDFCNQKYLYWKNKISLKDFEIKEALEQRLNEINAADLQRDWETALYTGMLKNQDLIDYLNSLIPKIKPEPETIELEEYSTLKMD
jgi:5-methylcytosine-specific restriction endonuclease McrA